MAHPEQRQFVEIVARHLKGNFNGCKVLEVGSLDVNGSVRDFFHACDYTGIDVAPGRGVDLVCQGQDFAAPDNFFDTVISCEAMEHNPHWAETFRNMLRACKPGGLLLLTCATSGRPEHGTSRTTAEHSPLTVELGWEYYHNLTPAELLGCTNFKTAFSHYGFWRDWSNFDLYFCGQKIGDDAAPDQAWEAMTRTLDAHIGRKNRGARNRLRALIGKFVGDRGVTWSRELLAALRLNK